MNEITKLQDKLAQLREKLLVLETVETEKMREKRLRNDMGDDYRENEGAKMVMEDHQLLHMRISNLKKEIGEIKKRLILLSARSGSS